MRFRPYNIEKFMILKNFLDMQVSFIGNLLLES